MAFGMFRTGGHSLSYYFSTVNTIMLISDFLPSLYTVRKYRIGRRRSNEYEIANHGQPDSDCTAVPPPNW